MYGQVAEHIQSHAVNSDWIADERKALGEFGLTIFCNFLSVLCLWEIKDNSISYFILLLFNYMKKSRIEAV